MGRFTKKIGLALACLLIPAFVWAQDIPQKEAKVLIVYYSRTGHTQLTAEKLAKKFNADLERLIDKKNRMGLIGFIAAGKDAIFGKTTIIEPLKLNPRDYEIIIIGGPSWNGNVTPAVRTFIMQNDLSNKKIGLFGLCHITGVENAIQEAADLISKGKNKKFTTLPLREGELKEEVLTKKIDAFYQTLQATK
jgi:flavodoxin